MNRNTAIGRCRYAALAALFSMMIGSGAAAAPSKAAPILGSELTAGQHAVGFKTLFLYDRSKPSIPYSDWDGRLTPTSETAGRQMQLSIWYPAEASQTGNSVRLKFGHYVDLLAQQTDFGPLDDDKRAFADRRFVSHTNDLGGQGSFTSSKLQILKKLDTRAVLNANPTSGSFPLIVFPNGASPAFQSIMCEYLASYGFVVAGVALKGQHAFTGGASLKGLEMAVQDLDFAVRALLEIPQVNQNAVGMIGNANTSSHIVAYQSRNAIVDAIVSLDGGLLSEFEQKILRRSPFYEPQAVNVPILAIYAPHPSIDPKHIFDLVFSERYFLHFPQMTEFHFLNYGLLENFSPGIIGEAKGDVQSGFATAALYSLRFFEAKLLDNKSSQAFINSPPPPSATSSIDKHFVMQALPTPPNLSVVKNAITNGGMDYLEGVYSALRKNNPAPFSLSFFGDLKDWLAWKKDPDFEKRYRLYALAIDSFPESATAHYYFAYFALKTNRGELAKTHNVRALGLLETDRSAELTNDRRDQMKAYILEDLEGL